MPYCEYLRKSRVDLEAEANGAGDTLARHEAMLDALADRRGYVIGKRYREVVSGDNIVDRPVMQQLLADVEAGLWEGVLVAEVERLARGDTVDQGTVARAFRYSETKIITPNKTYDPNNEFDEEYFEFSLFMSRREYKTIRRRLTAGVQASRREGKYTGSTPPIGYDKIKLPGKGYKLVPNDKAPLVREIFRLFTEEKMNMNQIARHLTKAGIPAPGGTLWYQRTVHNLLANPHYAGYTTSSRYHYKKIIKDGKSQSKRVWNDSLKFYPGQHEAIIEPSIWQAVQQELGTHTKPPVPRGQSQKNAFTGYLICGLCGSKLQRSHQGIYRFQEHKPYLFCPSRSRCHCVSSNYDDVEKLVLAALNDWLSSYSYIDDAAPDITGYEQRLKALAREEDKIKAREARAFELVETGVYTPDIYLERKAALDLELSNLAAQKVHLLHTIEELKNDDKIRAEFLPNVRRVIELYPLCQNAKEQRDLLLTVIDHIVYHKTERVIHTHQTMISPGNLRLDVYPRLPKSITPPPAFDVEKTKHI